jgi:hypothetical protein
MPMFPQLAQFTDISLLGLRRSKSSPSRQLTDTEVSTDTKV